MDREMTKDDFIKKRSSQMQTRDPPWRIKRHDCKHGARRLFLFCKEKEEVESI